MRFKDKLKWELHLLNYKMKDFSVSKYIKEMIEFHKEYNKYGKEFNMLFDEISRYELEMLPEVNKLKSIGHEHFAKVELEDKILNIIDQDEGILTYQGEQLYNLGMICAKAGLDKEIWQYFAVLTGMRSVGVMGDERTYDYTIALRGVNSIDGMTADWFKIPHDVLDKCSNRIVNECKHINRVVYDITSKPPATIEWE